MGSGGASRMMCSHRIDDVNVAVYTAVVGRRVHQLPPAGIAVPETLLKVLLAFDPSVVMAAMHTTMMRASMTAYSTAVGPSSRVRNVTSFLTNERMLVSRFCVAQVG